MFRVGARNYICNIMTRCRLGRLLVVLVLVLAQSLGAK